MKRSSILTAALILVLLLSGCFALAEPEAASGTVAAPTLEASAAGSAEDQAQTAAEPPAAQEAEAYPVEETTVEAAPQPQDAYPADEAYPGTEAGESASNADGASPASAGARVFVIDPARSEARFTINEVLRNEPTVVVGRTSNLGGEIALDFNDPASAQVGEIAVNARDIATDNNFRNNAIANEILHTNQYELITFQPTAITGMPAAVAVGQTYPLQITGDLTIVGQTREVTFDAEVTAVSETEIQGLAQLDVQYADFGLTIPFARAVQSVEDHVLLELEFTAVAQ